MAKGTESGDVFDMSRMQQPIDHIEDKQRLHPVIGEAFPSLGECDVSKAARMTEKTAIFGAMHRRRLLRPAQLGKRSACYDSALRKRLVDLRERNGIRETIDGVKLFNLSAAFDLLML